MGGAGRIAISLVKNIPALTPIQFYLPPFLGIKIPFSGVFFPTAPLITVISSISPVGTTTASFYTVSGAIAADLGLTYTPRTNLQQPLHLSTLSITINNLGCPLNVTDVIAFKLPNLVATTGPISVRLQNATFPILKMKGQWDNSSNTLFLTYLGMYKYYRNHTRAITSKLQTKQNLPTGTKFTVFINTTSVSPTNQMKSPRFTATNMAMIQNDPRWGTMLCHYTPISFQYTTYSRHDHFNLAPHSYPTSSPLTSPPICPTSSSPFSPPLPCRQIHRTYPIYYLLHGPHRGHHRPSLFARRNCRSTDYLRFHREGESHHRMDIGLHPPRFMRNRGCAYHYTP